ncbi:MAG: hypothetical protein WD273_14115 [Trueperaceae bacterium]
MRLIPLLITFSLLSSAFAQRCQPELQQTAASLPADTPTGILSAELLSAAIHWVEPALPPLAWSVTVPVAPDEPGYDAVRYLTERRLLPDGWSARDLSAQAWEAMLSRFLGWYGLPPVDVAIDPLPQQLTMDLAAALEQVSGAVRPLALVAADSEDRSRIAFLGLVWNWTVYPRLIVQRPLPGQDLSHGVRPLLEDLSNCAVELEHYIFAPEATARNLFLAHADSRMYVIGSEPELTAWPLLVPEGQEEAYFGFSSPQVSELSAYAAAFDGSALGLRSLMAMMPRLRTNLPPTRIPGLLRTPNGN